MSDTIVSVEYGTDTGSINKEVIPVLGRLI